MFEVKRKPNTTSSESSTASGTARALTGPAESTVRDDLSAMHLKTSPEPLSSRQRNRPPSIKPPTGEIKNQQTKLPVITGEAQYNGVLRLDGTATGQMAASGGSLNVRQRSRSFLKEPEFAGDISFRDMVRVNGHIAGTVYSQKGTLIVDVGATVDSNVEVAVVIISGTVNGDIVAHDRVELGPGARIYGNIWTRAIEIKNGAIFEGLCTMISEKRFAG
ncbi:MAG: polymer-forming cytoskeletal protein [Acidobacteriota bacterium]